MNNIIKNLQIIPWVWPKLAKEFLDIWIESVSDFKAKDPEELYFQICVKHWMQVDKCVLYVLRLCVYFAEKEIYDSKKLK